MAFEVALASFSWSSTNALASTIAVTGAGFQPKAVVAWCSQPNSAIDSVSGGSLFSSIGMASAATERGCITWTAADASSSHATAHTGHDAAILETVHHANNGILGLLDLQSFDADGATFVVDNLLEATFDVRVMVMLLGGDDLTNAKMLHFTASASTGTQDLTGFGFDPTCCLFLMHGDTPSTSATTHGRVMLGACDEDGNTGVFSLFSQSAANPSDNYSYCREGGELIAFAGDGQVSNRAEFSAYITDGIRVNWLEAGSAALMVLGLRGGSYKIKPGTTQTDTVTPIVISGAGFQPAGGLVVSAGNAESVADTPDDHFRLSMGAFTSTTDRFAMANIDVDNVTGSSTLTRAVEYDAVYANLDTADAIQGLMDVQSVDSGGATFIMDDADPSGAFFWTLLFGDNATPAAPSTGFGPLLSHARNRLVVN